MKLRAQKPGRVAVVGAMAGILMVAGSAWGQALPTDWSNRHLLHQHGVETSKAEAGRSGVTNDPRRFAVPLKFKAPIRNPVLPRRVLNPGVGKVDWNVSLGSGTLAEGAFPAKYSFDPSVAESCTNDWVLYGTNVAGSQTVPNVVAYTNVYPSPVCSGTVPTLKFAYYVAGPITTSPVISLDGTKIAFVEGAYNGAHAKLHVVSTLGAGSLAAPVAPPGDTSIDLGSSDTLSSPFVDYVNDIAYVGADDGYLYKITGVFSGTPTAAGAPWPVQLSPLLKSYGTYAFLTSPVLYTPTGSGMGVVLVAGNFLASIAPETVYSTLFSVDANTGAQTRAIQVGGASVSDGPLVDLTNNVAYLFSGNSTTTYPGSGPAAVEQVALNYSGGTFSFGAVTQALIGGVASGGKFEGLSTIHSGAFDNGWYTSPTGAGYLLACGTGSTTAVPTLYSFQVSGSTLTTTAAGSTPVSSSVTDFCSPITEAYDGSTDRFFIGTQKNGVTCGNTGCIQSFTLSSGVPQIPAGQTENGGTSAIVVDPGTGSQTYIYFTTLSNSGNPAIQLSQQNLQ
jgi:hypothetical protein